MGSSEASAAAALSMTVTSNMPRILPPTRKVVKTLDLAHAEANATRVSFPLLPRAYCW